MWLPHVAVDDPGRSQIRGPRCARVVTALVSRAVRHGNGETRGRALRDSGAVPEGPDSRGTTRPYPTPGARRHRAFLARVGVDEDDVDVGHGDAPVAAFGGTASTGPLIILVALFVLWHSGWGVALFYVGLALMLAVSILDIAHPAHPPRCQPRMGEPASP